MGLTDFQERLGCGLPVDTGRSTVDVRNHSKVAKLKCQPPEYLAIRTDEKVVRTAGNGRQ